jgi:hypothetical protein
MFHRGWFLFLAVSTLFLVVTAPSHPWHSGAALAEDAMSAERQAFESAKELGTVEAWEAFLSNYSKGFHADLARAYVKKLAGQNGSAATNAPAAAPGSPATKADSVTLTATPIRVGKWPERAAFDGRSLWVSESGARSIIEIDLQTRAVGRRLKVGRLPVDMVATENGTVYALSETDNMIYALARTGNDKAGEYAAVPRCADLMAYADNNLWVVSNVDCSTPSVLTRVSHLNGRTAKVADLQGSTSDIEAAHGFVYVGHMSSGGRAAFLSIVEGATGNATASPDLPVHYPRLAANASAVFVGGAPSDQNTGIVLKLPAGQAQFAAKLQLPEPIAAIGATDQYVTAIGRGGNIFVLAASDLTLLRTIDAGINIEPKDVLAVGNMLAVVSSAGNEVAQDNVVYLIDGWIPGSAAPQPFVAAPPRAEPVAEQSSELKCAKGYKKVRGECVMLQNCGANASRSPEGDCYCDKNYDMQNGKCVRRQKKPAVVDNCPGDSVLKNGKCVKEAEPDFRPPVKCTGGQLYSLSQQRCACQDGLAWNGQRCYLP